jgi:hypothetical protein
MTSSTRLPRIYAGTSLFFLIVSIYLLTYRGLPFSRDELYLLDGIESITNHGFLARTYQFNDGGLGAAPRNADVEPWLRPPQEPLMMVVSVPFFKLAQALPNVGTMHVLWIFNIIITALTAVSLYALLLMLGHNLGVAWWTGLLFAIGTIAWFYGRVMFREPLMGFFVAWMFGAALLARERLHAGTFPLRYLGIVIIALLGALATKAVTALLLPGLMLLFVPPLHTIKRFARPLLLIFAGLASVLLVGVMILQNVSIGIRYDFSQLERIYQADWEFVLESLLGYQVGVSRSIWLYSPVLLLALWGGWRMIRRRSWALALGIAASIVLFSLWYGISLRLDWSGGWGWGPRYMLPIIPAMMFLVAEALVAVQRIGSRRVYALVGLLAGLGIFVQLLGMANPQSNYYTDLFWADKLYDYDDYVESEWHWMAGNWQVEWSPIYYHLERFEADNIDIAWRVAEPQWAVTGLGLAALAVVVHGGGGLWLLRRRLVTGIQSILVLLVGAGLTLAAFTAAVIGLRDDPRVIEEWADVRQLAEQVDAQANGDDIVLVNREQYIQIFMNYFKSPALVAALPYAPGEDYGDGALVEPDAPLEERIGARTAYLLDWLANRYSSLWLITSSSPFEQDKHRPAEAELVTRYFHVQEIATSPHARAIQFLPLTLDGGPQVVEAAFGENILLTRVHLPPGLTFQPGDGLPVELTWQINGGVERDYNIGLYLIGADGVVITQKDGQPGSTFGGMTTWTAGEEIADRHGLVIPKDTPPGEYRLSLAVYWWEDGERLAVMARDMHIDNDALTLAAVRIE